MMERLLGEVVDKGEVTSGRLPDSGFELNLISGSLDLWRKSIKADSVNRDDTEKASEALVDLNTKWMKSLVNVA